MKPRFRLGVKCDMTVGCATIMTSQKKCTGVTPKLGTDLFPAQLGISRYRLHFVAEKEIWLQGYRGSAWRGVLGHALKRMVCVTRAQVCEGCLLEQSCTYPYVFETPTRQQGVLGRSPAAPHPFVLEVAAKPERGRRREMVGLTMIGRGQQHAAYLIHALGQAGAQGLRPENVPLQLVEVERESEAGSGKWVSAVGESGLEISQSMELNAPPEPRSLEILFHTPIRLKRDNDLLTPATFELSDLIKAVVRRLAMLCEYHTDTPWTPDFRAVMDAAGLVRWSEKDLGWLEWTRVSQKQKTEMQMGGIVGCGRVDGDAWRPWWPLLWLGQFAGAGKATSMGLGRYEVRPP